MNERIADALATDRVIDITTTGRKSGRTVRKEMWFHNLDGDLYLTGTPGKRDWYANLVENPDFIFHLKVSAAADLPAHATPITDVAERKAVLGRILANINRPPEELERWVADSPLVAVRLAAR